MEGTPDYSQARTFQIGVGGGGGRGGTYGPSGYAAAYLEGQGIMDMLDAEDKRRRQAIEEEYAAERQTFARNQELRAQQDQKLQEMAAVAAAKKAQDQERLASLKAQRDQDLEDQFGKVTAMLEIIDPLDKDAAKKIKDIHQSNEFLSLIANRNLRPAALEAFKGKEAEVAEVRSGLQQIAQDEYGVGGFDFDSIPATKSGQIDYRGFHSMMQKQSDEMKRRAEEAVAQAQAPAGYTPEIAVDPYGRPFVKGKVKAPLTPDQQLEKDALNLQKQEYIAGIKEMKDATILPKMRSLEEIKSQLRKARMPAQPTQGETAEEAPEAQTPSTNTEASATTGSTTTERIPLGEIFK